MNRALGMELVPKFLVTREKVATNLMPEYQVERMGLHVDVLKYQQLDAMSKKDLPPASVIQIFAMGLLI